MDVREKREVAKSGLERMLGVLQKVGNNWPPYPQNFEIPEGIRGMWNYKHYSYENVVPVLRGGIHGGLQIGDRFNAVPLPKKRKIGHKYFGRHQRIFQFFFMGGRFFGHVVFDEFPSGAEVLEKGQVRKDMVYRFEIISIDEQKHVFYCAPLVRVFNRYNLLYNLMNCNYGKR